MTRMMDIERISEKIREEKDNLIAKAFTCQISSLLLTNGIVPIMTEHNFENLETITDRNRYKLVYELGISFDSLDTSEHDAKVRAKAIDEFVKYYKLNPCPPNRDDCDCTIEEYACLECMANYFKRRNK